MTITFPVIPPHATYVRNAVVQELIDGDTLEVLIDNGRKSYDVERLRLAGVDTPETFGKERPAGEYVEKKVFEWLDLPDDYDIVLDSVSFKLDSWSRIICLVWSKGRLLNKWLLDEGLGWPTDKRGKLVVPRDISSLNLPADIIELVQNAQD